MDERTLVPAMLPIVTLNGHSNIPSNLPLQSIAARVVVPRDIQREAYSVVEDHSIPLQVTEMDQRIAVPQNSAPPEPNVKLPVVDPDLVDPDIFMTGEAHLMVSPPSPEKARADLVTRISSVVLHVALIAAEQRGPYSDIFVRSLARVGVEGTAIHHYLTDAAGRTRAKTGHINGVNGLAGIVQSRHHGRIAFDFIVNDPRANADVVTEEEDRALDALSDF